MTSSWRTNDKAVPARGNNERDLHLVISAEQEEGEDIEMDEIEDFTRLPYPAAWDRDTEDSDAEDEIGHAAHAWYRAMALIAEQGFAPEDCEAEIMRRCARVSRGQRAMDRRTEESEAEYAALAADESVCEFPWGRLCPEHGNTLTDTRRGVRCGHEDCERRWPAGHKDGHCDLPAAVVTASTFKPSGEWRLCAGHRNLYPDGPVLRTVSTVVDRPAVTEQQEGDS